MDDITPDPLAAFDAKLTRGFDQLLETFQSKLAYDSFKERQIDALHRELQDHKSDLLAKTMRPIFSALIRLYSDTDRMIAGLRVKPAEELTPDLFFSRIGDFRDDIRFLLANHGVAAFEDIENGDEFNGRRQQAVGFVSTPDPERGGLIAERVCPGFDYGNMLIQKEWVKVFRYERQPG